VTPRPNALTGPNRIALRDIPLIIEAVKAANASVLGSGFAVLGSSFAIQVLA
jgi:hypothetical protein